MYFQVSLLTVIGLAGKTTILIVEFACEQANAGVAEAAKQRFRRILTTSMAFSFGASSVVLPSGRTAIGSGVLSGAISGTVLCVLFVPVFFAVIHRLSRQRT